MKKVFLVLFLVLLCVVVLPVKIKGADVNDEKVYCNASIDDEFVDNQVLVALSKENSLNYYDYKINDFVKNSYVLLEISLSIW